MTAMSWTQQLGRLLMSADTSGAEQKSGVQPSQSQSFPDLGCAPERGRFQRGTTSTYVHAPVSLGSILLRKATANCRDTCGTHPRACPTVVTRKNKSWSLDNFVFAKPSELSRKHIWLYVGFSNNFNFASSLDQTQTYQI